jgi:hypothetical protein
MKEIKKNRGIFAELSFSQISLRERERKKISDLWKKW